MNDSLNQEFSEEELNNILHSFQKSKIPGLDGFTLEFFLGFYDLIKEDILKVVIESQQSEKVLGGMNSTFLALIPKKTKANKIWRFQTDFLLQCGL